MGANYEVISQFEGYDVGEAGAPVQVMAITAKTVPSGVTFTQNVPIKDYTAAHVADVLTARAATIEQVHAGGG